MHTRIIGFLFLCLGINPVTLAQLTVTFPTTRAVFQRDNANQTTLYMGGTFANCLDQVEARVVPRAGGQGTATDWTLIQIAPSGGQFYGSISVTGGWYNLEVRGKLGGNVTGTSTVERVGVGEVFLVAGQSNSTGGDGLPNGPSATDDRVNSVNFQNYNPNNGTIQPYSNVQLPCPEFVHLDAEVKTAPFGNYAWCWGIFGDSLARRLNVPVMIFNAGWAGSAMYNWQESIDPNATTVSTFGNPYPTGLPFGHLRLALNYYIAQQGYRAVLWHQGEADNFIENSREGYRNGLRAIIQASRSLSGKPNLAWVVARASRFTKDGVSRIWQPVIDGQNDVIGVNGNDPNLVLPNVFPGPQTDPLEGPAFRTSDNIHFTGNGLVALAQSWVSSLNNLFIANSQPYLPIPPPQVLAQCGGNNALTFQAPGGWVSYQWHPVTDCNQTLSFDQNWTATTGNYVLKVRDALQNTVLSPAVAVPVSTAADVSASGTTTVSQGDNLTLQSSSSNACSFAWTGPNQFTSTQPNVLISNATASQSGTYTVSAKNAYGCQAQSSVSVQVVSIVESVASGDWGSTATWSCGCLPTPATDVRINEGHTISIGTPAKAKNVFIQNGNIQYQSGGSLMLSQ
ncbi:sialate O-acetylesterase [Salmonirosea aquatica]|uniref:T9SS C-terminal target domain-containing protein n=1 Tax=Salmonirosea aquatica TaxID=2654236 RepID=A0A7C9BCD4_9BACT|nr:T9SS C-terminal target domain-containing protein [Cytophagaceae bacterium SJW1-29]